MPMKGHNSSLASIYATSNILGSTDNEEDTCVSVKAAENEQKRAPRIPVRPCYLMEHPFNWGKAYIP